MQFVYKISPMLWDYYAASEDEERTRGLHEKYAPRTLAIVLDMKGYYIKAAQMLCGIGILPDAYGTCVVLSGHHIFVASSTFVPFRRRRQRTR